MLGHFFSKKPKKGDCKPGALDICQVKVHKDKRQKRVGLNEGVIKKKITLYRRAQGKKKQKKGVEEVPGFLLRIL